MKSSRGSRNNVFLSKIFVEISVVQFQVETETGVYSSSTLVGVSSCTYFFCCSMCWPALVLIATLGLGS